MPELEGQGSQEFSSDPYLTFTFRESGTYFVEISQSFPVEPPQKSFYDLQISLSDSLFVEGGLSAQTNSAGIAGNITITADTVNLGNSAAISTETTGSGAAGNITLTANQLTLAANSQLSATVQEGATTQAEGGKITLNVSNLDIAGKLGIFAETQSEAPAGNLRIQPNGTDPNLIIEFTNNGFISASTKAGGNGGSINLSAPQSIDVSGLGQISVETTASGEAGAITLNAPTITLRDGVIVSGSTSSSGDGGDLAINAPTRVQLTNARVQTTTSGSGNAGGITITAGELDLSDASVITADTTGDGSANTIRVNAQDSINLGQDTRLSVETSGAGKPGDIEVTTPHLSIGENAQLSATVTAASTNTEGGGNITLNISDLDITGRLGIFAETNSLAQAGDLVIQPNGTDPNLDITFTNNGFISASTTAVGDGGSINLIAPELIDISGLGQISVETSGLGNAGSINFTAPTISLGNGVTVSGSTSSSGQGGNLAITAPTSLQLSNSRLQTTTTEMGQAGGITINTGQLNLLDTSVIAADTSGEGNANSIMVNATQSVNLGQNTRLSVETSGAGSPGDIEITTPVLTIGKNAQLSATVTATSTNQEGGGNISLNASDIDISGKLGIFAETNSLAQAGDLEIRPTCIDVDCAATDPDLNIQFTDNGFISASTTAQGNGGSINIAAPQQINISGQGRIAVETSSQDNNAGDAGNITLNAPRIALSDGVTISAETVGKGDSGNIRIIDATRVDLRRATISTAVETRTQDSGEILKGQGNAGTISFNPQILNLRDGSLIRSSTKGEGSAGSITITDADSISLDDSTISTAIELGGVADPNEEPSNIILDTETLALDNGSAITADTQGVGDAGNIDLSTVQTVTIASNSRISSSTSGQGNSGTIDLTGTQTITGTGGTISTAVLAGGQGQGGSITIATDTLDLNDTDITSSTAGEGDTGTIAITARQGATLDQNSEISTAVESGATGNAQQIDIFTPQLSLNQSQITASTSGTGNAGKINLTGIDGISTQQIGLNNNSAITTAVTTGAIGNAGQITLETRQLNLTTGSQIASSSDGQGRAGRITAQNVNSLTLDNSTISTEIAANGTAETLNESDRGNITLSAQLLSLDNGSTITARTDGFREPGFNDAGQIDLTTATTTLNNGSAIQTNTAGSGTAGNINLIATEGLFLSDPNSGIFSSTEEGSTGNAGNITIDPPIVDIRDGAGVAVNSLGSGLGGNITLFAGNLNLTNNAFISALTRSSGGGNIDLLIGNNLILQNNSFISTEAGTAQAGGNGGNITLNSFFTIGRNNSDIIANAFEGNGGSINITTRGLFGFIVKNVDNPRQDPRNNITASSRFGSSGTTNISTTVDPAQGLGTLPGNLVDPSSLIDRRCAVTNANQVSRFNITGRGGLPITPSQLLQTRTQLEDLGSPWVPSESFSRHLIPELTAVERFSEAQGFHWQSNGKTILWANGERSFRPPLPSNCP